MSDSFFKTVVVFLLIANTFFIGSLWRAMAYNACGFNKASFCPFSKKKAAKICPITGKALKSGMQQTMQK
jgi:hypothetical protein